MLTKCVHSFFFTPPQPTKVRRFEKKKRVASGNKMLISILLLSVKYEESKSILFDAEFSAHYFDINFSLIRVVLHLSDKKQSILFDFESNENRLRFTAFE